MNYIIENPIETTDPYICYRCGVDLLTTASEEENGKSICRKCYELLSERYPQGWNYYAGDTCKHGVYTGGCGVDLMCPQCEA